MPRVARCRLFLMQTNDKTRLRCAQSQANFALMRAQQQSLGVQKNNLQALHAQAPGSAPCNHELSCVHDRLATPKKRSAKPQHSARAVRRCRQQPKAMRATGSATYHSSLEPKRLLHINDDRIDHQPVVIRLAKRLELGQPHIGSHDKQLGIHPNIVSEAAGGRLT